MKVLVRAGRVGGRFWDLNLYHDFLGIENGLERPNKKFLKRDGSFAVKVNQLQLRLQD